MMARLKTVNGEFVRADSTFRNWITADGSAGPSGDAGFKAESGRYHLYISHACPWAHRTMIFRALKQLQDVISVSVVHPVMPEESWVFGDYPGSTPDHLFGSNYLYQVYEQAEPGFDGIITVPALWDREQGTIVNNESSEIIRMLNSAFNDISGNRIDFYPAHLRRQIDQLNRRVYDSINNGVYRAGFAKSQSAYAKACEQLFATLDDLEASLSSQRFLCGDRITEADWRLFTTLVRFDAVYYSHFKTNRKRLIDYPNLWAYTRDLYQVPGIADTIDMDHIKRHYFASHRWINPTGIVPLGPDIDFQQAHHRGAHDDLFHVG